MADFLQETIEEHRRTFDPSNLRDLLDTYLLEIQKATEAGTDRHLFEGRDHGMYHFINLTKCTLSELQINVYLSLL